MNQKSHCTAILPAAGSGKRMGKKTQKQFLELNGKEIIAYTIESFEQCQEIDEIILVTSKENIEKAWEIVKREGFQKVSAVVEGGEQRQHSVYAGLCAVSEKTDFVAVHDGVRPFVTAEDIAKTIAVAKQRGACALGVKTKDTIKICDEENKIIQTPKRDFVWCIQTPQVFEKKLLCDAFEKAMQTGFTGTDEAALVEQMGRDVFVTEGHYDNIKITTVEDMLIAEAFVKKQPSCCMEKKQPNKKVIIYTDGACSGNPGAGGYGAVLLYGEKRKELSQGYRVTTNNRMEVLAVIKALEALKGECDVTLYSDSKYVVDAIKKGWAKKWKANGWRRNQKEMASNIDLWERLLELLEKHHVTFQWVKGHANNTENERCDFLARKAIEENSLLEDENYQ